MNTFILNAETSSLSIEDLLKQLSNEGIEVRDAQGNLVAFILSPMDKEALTYAEAKIFLDQHRDQLEQALQRRGGITTAQLLERAALAADKAAR